MLRKETISKTALALMIHVDWLVSGACLAFGRGSLNQKMHKMDRYYANWEVNSALRYAEARGYLQGRKGKFEITSKGRIWVDGVRVKQISFKPRRHGWDKMWRVIVFDIPESRRDARDMLRRKLFEWECSKLQNSVFVTPYACEKELKQVSRILCVEECLHIILSHDLGLELTQKLMKEYKLK